MSGPRDAITARERDADADRVGGSASLRNSAASTPATPSRTRRHPEPTPVQRALALLTRREHSAQELQRKLTARGIEPDAARAAVGTLAQSGWQDDARFAELLVRSRASAGQGPVRIRAELGTHGLDPDVVAAAMDAFEGDWSGNARGLALRRYGANLPTDPALRRKAADFLIRRGFTTDHVRAATRFDPDAQD